MKENWPQERKEKKNIEKEGLRDNGQETHFTV